MRNKQNFTPIFISIVIGSLDIFKYLRNMIDIHYLYTDDFKIPNFQSALHKTVNPHFYGYRYR